MPSPKTSRRSIPLKDKLASALLRIPGLIPDGARTLSSAEICKLIEWDHIHPVALGGDDSPQNIRPILIDDHKIKTHGRKHARVDSDRFKISKSKRLEAARLAVAGVVDAKPDVFSKPKAKIKSRGFQGSRRFNGELRWKENTGKKSEG